MSRLFISCVSNEFASYREVIRKDLSRPNVDTKIQEDFIAYGGATLEKLDEYIQHCDAVIHICGDMTGSMANDISLKYLNEKYHDFANRFPVLQPVLTGRFHLSYTQWEAWLAIYHGKRLFIATPSENAVRDSRYVNDQEQSASQLRHLSQLNSLGYYGEIQFNNEDELVKNLYRSKLGDILNEIPKIKPVNLPYHSIGNFFKGRQEFIRKLDKAMAESPNNVIGIALYGLGGIGKTRLAVEYAWQRKDNFTGLLFLNAGSPDAFKTNIIDLADPQVLNLPEHKTGDGNIKYAAVISWLNLYKRWLLVLDNVDSDEAVAKVEELFGQLQHGQVLITTRMDNWSRQIKKMHLDVLDKDDAVDFLLEATGDERIIADNDAQLAAEITESLGYLALALEQARAYINAGELSLAAYQRIWKSNHDKILGWFDKRLMQYPSSVAITWQTSFDQLSTGAKILLNRFAWLAPEPLPKRLLGLEVFGTSTIDVMSSWQELKRYSLIASNADRTSFSIHRLVQDVTRNNLDETDIKIRLAEAVKWIDNAFTGDPRNVDSWPILDPLIPHVICLIGYADENKNESSVIRLLSQLGLLLYKKGQYSKAEYLMRKALAIDEKNLGKTHQRVAILLSNLGQLLQDTGQLSEAESLVRKALTISEQTLAPNHPTIGTDLNNLAGILRETNRLQEAEPLMRRALAIGVEHFGSNHPTVAIEFNNLAKLLENSGRFEEAESLFKKAIAINEQIFGPDHPNVAMFLFNLGGLFMKIHRKKEAELLVRRAFAIDEKSFGPNHPNVARDLRRLAALLHDTDRLGEAEQLLRRSLTIDEQSFGENNPKVANCLNELAQVLRATDQFEETASLIQRVINIKEQNFGPIYPNIAFDLNNLAIVFQESDRLPEAELIMRRAFIICLKNQEANDPNLKRVADNYVTLLYNMGKNEEEIKYMLDNLKDLPSQLT